MSKISMKARIGGATILMLLCANVAFAQYPSGESTGAPPPGFPAGGPPPGSPPQGGEPPTGAPPGFPAGGPPPIPPVPEGAPDPSPDPRNFDGTWFHEQRLEFQIDKDIDGHPTPFNPAGQRVKNRRIKSLKDGTPFINASTKCMPVGHPWQLDINMPFVIYQSKDRFDVIFEQYHGFWQIVMDPAKAPPPGYMGTSIAHWDGDTLVVETTGFKEPIWVDTNGTPASKDAKLTQRIRKVKTDRWSLEVVFTLDDPTYYTRPWSWVREYMWRPDYALFLEYNCEFNTGAEDGLDPSLVPEPKD